MYVGHGAPLVAIEDGRYQDDLRKFVNDIPLPKAIAVFSAHWEMMKPVQVTGSPNPKCVYDFWGFPQELYEIQYPAHGAPDLAGRIASMLTDAGFPAILNEQQGLDHGAWIPLCIMYPEANVPVLQISIPIPRIPDELVKMGRILSYLRADGVLLVGSGNIVHNLRLAARNLNQERDGAVDGWASDFDEWIGEKLEGQELKALLSYRSEAPSARLAVPTTEHFDPLFLILGTALNGDSILQVHESFQFRNISMRCFQVSS